jgi:hypothetical protein
MYSIMLYMRTRVTFRVADDLAQKLRELPNQTSFVEAALREALRRKCPACGGTGRVSSEATSVSNFKRAALPPLDRAAALQLKQLVGLARRVGANAIHLAPAADAKAVGFAVARGDEVLLSGTLSSTQTQLLAH